MKKINLRIRLILVWLLALISTMPVFAQIQDSAVPFCSSPHQHDIQIDFNNGKNKPKISANNKQLMNTVAVQTTPVLPSLDEYKALIDLFNVTNGRSWKINTGWVSANPDSVEDVSSWYGVKRDANGHVTHIDLDGIVDYGIWINPATSIADFPGNNLDGTIPASIGKLKYLQFLNLGGNKLAGTIPAEIGSLTEMNALVLAKNSLTDAIPSEIGSCKKLQRLFLNNNEFNRSIPPSIGTLTELTVLNLNDNLIPGNIPESFGNLTKLVYLHIFNNKLEGPIPSSLGGMTALLHFEVNDNLLTGSIPESLSSLQKLTWFFVSNNNLSGEITTNFNTMTKLQYFQIENNQFESIPNLSTHPNKSKLIIAINNNDLDFGDLESLFTSAGVSPFKGITFNNQTQIGEEKTVYIVSDTRDSIGVELTGTHNIYQWQKKSPEVDSWVDVSGENSNKLIFETVSHTHEGKYRLKVTNSLVTGIEIYSKVISVYVTGAVLPPVAEDKKICAGQATILSATGSGDIFWYNAETGGTSIASGASFTTPPLTTETTFYVSQIISTTESLRRAVKVTIDSLPTVNAGPDRSLCSGVSAIIYASGNALQYSWSNIGSSETSITVTPNTSTTYTLTGTAANGCSTSDDITVVVNPMPSIEIYSSANSICLGGYVSLSATGGINYAWSNGKNQSAFQERPDTTTLYSVTVIDSNGCSGTAQKSITVDPDCPSAPEDLRAAALTTTQIRLTWTNTAVNHAGFKVERKVGTGNFQVIETIAPTTYTFLHSNLQPGTTYSYRVKAFKSSGTESSYSNTVTETTFTVDEHFVKETDVLINNVTDPSVVSTLAVGERINTWNYIDGMTRPLQKVVQEFSPAKKDLIQPIKYDLLGRASKQFLPYTVDNPVHGALRINALTSNGEQMQFYNGTTTPEGVAKEADNPYAETAFEKSPISRALKQSSPGKTWKLEGGKTTQNGFHSNTTNEILFWKIVNSSGIISLQAQEYYLAGELSKANIRDEQQNASYSYTDKFGRTICLRDSSNSTISAYKYFIYDDYGNVLFEITPEAVAKALAQTTMPKIIDQTLMDAQCYQFKYDSKLRLIEEKIPGALPTQYVYDKWDRMVLTQDANQRLSNTWLYVKYDCRNRPITKGILTDIRSSLSIQAALEGESIRFESRTTETGNVHGYSNHAFPTTSFEVLSVTYYDDYKFVQDQINDPRYNYQSSALSGLPSEPFKRTNGLATGGKVKVLNSSTWIWAVSYYDDQFRKIQTVANNHLGGIERMSSTFNFAGWLEATSHKHFESNPNKEISILKSFTRDHVGRLLTTKHQIDNNAPVTTSALRYNELGQLIETNLHVVNDSALQSVDYRYNIRGWLTSINNSSLEQSVNNDDDSDLFGMEIGYDNNIGIPATPQYNGNISAVKWSNSPYTTTPAVKERANSYQYDKFNRFTGSSHAEGDTTWITNLPQFTESNIQYNLNGNLKTLTRKDSAGSEIDKLSYNYGTGNEESNQILSINDDGLKERGFEDGNIGSTDYLYDANGNLTEDKNKKLLFEYNYRNQVSKITSASGDYLIYQYNALGSKLATELFKASGERIKRIDYLNPFIYSNDTLQLIFHEDGRIVKYQNEWEYQYALTDYQGNNRTLFTSKPRVHEYVATMETENAARENHQFQNLRKAFFIAANTTLGGNEVARVSSDNPVGPAISLQVMPGDVINAKVNAYYEGTDPGNASQNMNAIVSAVAGAFGVANQAIGEAGNLFHAIEQGLGTFGMVKDKQDNVPAAYLNYLLFDMNMVPLDAGFFPIGDGSMQKQSLQFTKPVEITEPGYIYIYVSNESETPIPVHFDDLSVHHEESMIIGGYAYYPFGAEIEGQTFFRERTPHRYSFQGKEYQSDLGVNMYDFEARMYDPYTGRWWVADPVNQFASPYVGMGNRPINGTDPAGTYFGIDDLVAAGIGGLINLGVNAMQGNLSGHGLWGGIGRGFAAFGAGAVGGVGALYPQAGGWVWGGAVVGATNAWLGGATTGKEIALGAGVGAISGVVGGGIGQAIGPILSTATSSIGNAVVRSMVASALGGAFTGGVLGGLGSRAMGGSFWEGAGQGALMGMATGLITGAVTSIRFTKPKTETPVTKLEFDKPEVKWEPKLENIVDNLDDVPRLNNNIPDGTPTNKLQNTTVNSVDDLSGKFTGGYKTFANFKSANGTAGKGYAWHHIVEQNPSNIATFGPEAIHHPNNLVKLPHGKGTIHAKVSGYYSSKLPGTNMIVRDYVKTLSYKQQYEYGINIMMKFGWKP
jgi:RHS repeat-associated protein